MAATANLAHGNVPVPPATAGSPVPQLAIGDASAGNSPKHVDTPSAFHPATDLAPAEEVQQGGESTSADEGQTRPPRIAASPLPLPSPPKPLLPLQPAALAQAAHAPATPVAGLPEFEVAVDSAAPSPQTQVLALSAAELPRGPAAEGVEGPQAALQTSKQPAPPQDSGRQPNAPEEHPEPAADAPGSSSAIPPSRQPAVAPDEQQHQGPALQPAAPAEGALQRGSLAFGEQILYLPLAETLQKLSKSIIVAGDQIHLNA